MNKSIQVLILISIVTILELFTSNNNIYFSIIKSSGVIVLIGLVKTIVKRYELKHMLPIAMILMLIPSVYAVDNPFYTPTCMNPSYDSGWSAVITSNNATNGEIRDVNIGTDGYFSGGNQRVYGGINILCAVSDLTTDGLISGTQRLFGTSEDGSVWYTDTPNLNYSSGFYNPGYISCSVDGNCNDLKKIGIMSATVFNRPIVIDSNGNVYSSDGTTITKYVKTLSYSPSAFYTITSGADYTPGTTGGGEEKVHILDLKLDNSDNLHVLIGSVSSHLPPSTSGYLSKIVVNNAGGKIATALNIATDSGSGNVYAGFESASMILDSTAPITNYTFVYYGRQATKALKHNSSNGTATTISTLSGITSVGYLYYASLQVYLTATTQNIIRSYVTSFIGQLPGSVGGGTAAELTYDVSTITSEQTTYSNNSQINLHNSIQFTTSILSLVPVTDYKWRTEIQDSTGLPIMLGGTMYHYSEYCTIPFLSLTCSMDETLIINPPTLNWTAGTYTAYLKEYNINTYTLATLDSVTFTVLNTSSNNTGVTITTPITSGTGQTTLNQWDEYVSYLGWGVNPISRLFFALMIITIVGIIGMKLAGGDAAMVGAFAPYIFFTYIEFIPKWIFVILVLMLVLKSKIFR